MRNNPRKLNRSIMFGVMGMAVAVLLVILLFWYLCIGKTPKTDPATENDSLSEQVQSEQILPQDSAALKDTLANR